MRRESVLSDVEKNSIIIEKFIFHVIIEDNMNPIFLDEVVLDESQKEFFKKRLEEASQGPQYLFADKSTSVIYQECLAIKDNPNKNFLKSSKIITALFRTHHKKSMSDGVFVIALVSILNKRKLLFLLKMDHKLVYRYKIEGTKAILEKIKDNFTEDRKTIQKAALIDMSDYYTWHLLASERDSIEIRDYFKDFLQVIDKDDAFRLTQKARSIARNWASENLDLLCMEDTPTSYRERAAAYLSGHEIFNSDEFIDYIIYDANQEKRKKAIKSFKEYMQVGGLYGHSFKPSAKALAYKKKNRGETAEGVILEWEGDPRSVNLTIPTERDVNDNLFHIVVKTSNLSYKN
jgi:hypothetical protein